MWHLNKYGHSNCFPLLQRGIEGDFLIQPGLIADLRLYSVNYLVATGKPVGLIICFRGKRAEINYKVLDLN